MRVKNLALLLLCVLAPAMLGADVMDSAANGFTIKIATVIHAGPADIYDRLVHHVGDWWSSDHTFSQDAHNLSTFCRLRLIVLIAVTTGMRVAEVFGLRWSDVMYGEGLLAVRAKLKGGKMRYVPMLPELAGELRRYPAVIGEDRIFPPKQGAVSGRQRVEGSFEDLLERAGIEDFRSHASARIPGLAAAPAAASACEKSRWRPSPIRRATRARVSRRTRWVCRRVSSPSGSLSKRRQRRSAMTRPNTRSPRNSRRSYPRLAGIARRLRRRSRTSALGWVRASARSSGRANSCPSTSVRSSDTVRMPDESGRILAGTDTAAILVRHR